jgi:tetratricopeptide (TPR) repeat protein
VREAERLYQQAILLDPVNIPALDNLATSERQLSHLEDAASDFRKVPEMLGRADTREVGYGAISFPVLQEMAANQTHLLMGAYGEYIPSVANIIRSGTGGSFSGLANGLARAEIGVHDLKAARAVSLDHDRQFQSADSVAFNKIRLGMDLADADENWPAVVADAASLNPLLKGRTGFRDRYLLTVAPVQAYAEARLGRFRSAEALIATTPGDCDECMLQRARIAEIEGQHARADWWFARAIHDAPSIPLMYSTWGQALLERGQPDAAIAQFKLANEKGPRFADPLEGWGEGLMAKSQSHLALAKFAEAEKYAPNWGRLHLKWGEALVYAGHADEAKAQFSRAAQLDLTPSEKSELARFKRV